MTDKLRKTYPLRITHGDGEQPSSQKLNAISEQTRNGLNIVERAVGDLWTQSGDTVLTDYPLMIPNLARMLGQNQYTNPPLFVLTDGFSYTEYIGTKRSGRTDGYLLFPPEDISIVDFTTSPADPGAGFSGSRQTEERNLSTPGDYYIDDATGRFRTVTPLDGTEVITYEVDPQGEWQMGEETLPGVIPDPRQADFYNLRVLKTTGPDKYYISLPPRRPLTLIARERPANYPPLGGAEQTANEATGTGGQNKLWQYDTDALSLPYYRYSVPKELLDVWLSIAEGEELPAGFLYLFDENSGTVIEDVVFRMAPTNNPFVIEVESATFDFEALITTTDDKADYESSGLRLITCGSPVARVLWSLSSAMYKHEHNQGVGEATISHNELSDLNPPTSDYSAHSARYPTYLPAWAPSQWEADKHTDLLSRAGAQAAGKERDIYNDAMLGDLLIANADTSTDNFINGACPDNSFKIFFGNVIDAAYIYCDATNGISAIANSGSDFTGLYAQGDGIGPGIYGRADPSGTGSGVFGSCSNGTGYGVNGWASASHGIFGQTNDDGHYGVYGYSTSGGGIAGVTTVVKIGVYGQSAGVGISGVTTSSTHYAITAFALNGHGILSETNATDRTAVYGLSALGDGIKGETYGAGKYGVHGIATTGYGVYGEVTTGYAIRGIATAVGGDAGYFWAQASGGEGIRAISTDNYAGHFSGHTNGGGSGRAAIHITTQSYNPTSVSPGDLYINTFTGALRVHDGANWNRVVEQTFARITDHSLLLNNLAFLGFTLPEYTIPGDSLVEGSVLRIRATLELSADADSPGTVAIRLTYGGSAGNVGPSGDGDALAIVVLTPDTSDFTRIIMDTQVTIRGSNTFFASTLTGMHVSGDLTSTLLADAHPGTLTLPANDQVIRFQASNGDLTGVDPILTVLQVIVDIT